MATQKSVFNVLEKPLADLIPYEANPRQNDDAVKAVAESIKRFGFRVPIIVDGDGVVIAGHTRLKAAKLLKLDTVPVHVASDLTEEQARALRVADNKTAELAEWDMGLLASELTAIMESGEDMDGLGFTEDELAALLTDGTEGETDPDDVPEPPAKTISKAGEIYLLGDHRLMCGDSTSPEDVGRLMDGEKADMMFTDPPYGVGYVGKTKDALTIESDDVSEDELERMCGLWFDAAEVATKDGSYWLATVPARPLHSVFLLDWKKRGILRQVMVWVKDSMVLGHSEYHYRHEPILFGWRPGGERLKNADRTKTTVWDFDRPKRSTEHPTMKPVEMWVYGIKNHTVAGCLLYEPFSGSGTTLIACEQLGRKCYGMEISPAYCDVIRKRWAEFVHGEGCDWKKLTKEDPANG